MKRCPHCGVQDHDEAILCKSCMRSFAAPPDPRARVHTPAQPQSSASRFLVRLVVLFALIWGAMYFQLGEKLTLLFLEWQASQSQQATEVPPAPPATLPDAALPPPPQPSPAAAETTAPPASASPQPTAAQAAAAQRRADARSPERPAVNERPEPRRPERAPAAESSPSPTPTPPSAQAVRVGGNIQAPAKVRDVRPVYPAAAQASRVQGLVIIEATIGPDGRVRETRVLRSVPLLDEAALEAVRQWEYEPTLLNGSPVPVIMTVTVNFRLQ